MAKGLAADGCEVLVIAFMNAYPNAKFFLRLDYEVSSFYHCTDASCSSYKNAFARIRSLIEGSSEVRFPIKGNFGGVVFLDYGNVWPDPWHFDLGDLHYAVGPGLRYLTPVGPARKIRADAPPPPLGGRPDPPRFQKGVRPMATITEPRRATRRKLQTRMLIDGQLCDDRAQPAGQRTASRIVSEFARRFAVRALAQAMQFGPNRLRHIFRRVFVPRRGPSRRSHGRRVTPHQITPRRGVTVLAGNHETEIVGLKLIDELSDGRRRRFGLVFEQIFFQRRPDARDQLIRCQ